MLGKKWRLIAYACGLPAFACITLWLVQIHQRYSWMSAVKKDFPFATETDLASRSIEIVCQISEWRTAMAGICRSYEYVSSLRTLAVVTLAGTVLLLLAVHWLGQRCKNERQLLLKYFQAGSHLMTGATLILVVSQAMLLAAILYFVPAEFTGRFFGGLIVFTLLGALLAVYRIIRLLNNFNKESPIEIGGKFLLPAEAPELWEFVSEVADSVGTELPNNIEVGTDATFFVTESAVKTPQRTVTGRTLYLSIPLCHVLTKTELRAILGHEFAHFHGRDTEFSRHFYPVFRNGTNTLQAVTGVAQSVGGGGYALLPAIWLLSFFLDCFSESEAEISRERELAADAVGARITSNRDFAVALTKVIQHDAVWEKVYSSLLESTTNDRTNLALPSVSFINLAESQFQSTDRATRIKELETTKLAHPADSHPPLCDRVTALGFTVSDLYDEAGNLRPSHPSSIMIPDVETLERTLFPEFAPKSQEAETVFGHRQAGFAAMEYYGLILNRSFLVYVDSQGLYGIKFRDFVSSSEGRYFDPALELLDDPWLTTTTESFQKAMKESRSNFFIPFSQIKDVKFDGTRKWGMGKIPHAGKLKIWLKEGTKREFILLGEAYGDGIARVILETRDRCR